MGAVLGGSATVTGPALGTAGIWTRALDGVRGPEAQDAVAELESLGYRTVWIPEALPREVLSHAAVLLAGSQSIVVATGIANIHARSPQAAALAQGLLSETYPDRFLLGLGVSHSLVVERVLRQSYDSPLQRMTSYLDAMDRSLGTSTGGGPSRPRVLAALGPRMLAIARERALGAHTYMATVEHTAAARQVLGPDSLLIPSVKAVLDGDARRAREVGARAIGPTLRLPAYRDNVRRVGFGEDEVSGAPSSRLVDALVAHGGVDDIVARVEEHLAAGADHVGVEIITEEGDPLPLAAWRQLAPALTSLDS